MEIHLPPGSADIIARLEACGHSAFLVGGCVRDSLMGVTPADYDIATSALPEETLTALKDCRVLPTGLKHGTVTVITEDGSYEVTTYRVDGAYTDHRRPDSVRFTPDITEDLSRRDFTVNAMAWNPRQGLVDPFGGADDLGVRLIRCVGEPARRFGEDALRILRAARFASRLDFKIDTATLLAMETQVKSVAAVSAERVFAELKQAVMGPGFGRIFGDNAFLLTTLIPEMAEAVNLPQNTPYHAYDVYTHMIRSVDAAAPDLTVRLAMLLHDMGKPACRTTDAAGVDHFKGHGPVSADMAEVILRRLRCDNRLRADVCELIRHHGVELPPEERAVRRWLGRIGETQLRRLVAVKQADNAAKAPAVCEARKHYEAAMTDIIDRVLREEQAFSLRQLAVKGGDLLALGMEPGPGVGSVLDALLLQVTEGGLPNEREALLKAAEDLMRRGY